MRHNFTFEAWKSRNAKQNRDNVWARIGHDVALSCTSAYTEANLDGAPTVCLHGISSTLAPKRRRFSLFEAVKANKCG